MFVRHSQYTQQSVIQKARRRRYDRTVDTIMAGWVRTAGHVRAGEIALRSALISSSMLMLESLRNLTWTAEGHVDNTISLTHTWGATGCENVSPGRARRLFGGTKRRFKSEAGSVNPIFKTRASKSAKAKDYQIAKPRKNKASTCDPAQ